jgi:tRNA(Arg) A34 adenosine deaminase TadA
MKTAKIIYKDFIFTASGGDFLESPIRELIEFIYRERTQDSRYILRQPIWLNYEPSQYEQALIKIGAKRYRVEEPLALAGELMSGRQVININQMISGASINYEIQQDALVTTQFSSRDEVVNWFRRLAEPTGVVAAYVTKDHKVLSYASNTNGQIKTQHAEMNLVSRLTKIKQDEGDYVLVSLQSCRMCAAALSEWMGSNKNFVYYLKPEQNLLNVKTALYQREFVVV